MCMVCLIVMWHGTKETRCKHTLWCLRAYLHTHTVFGVVVDVIHELVHVLELDERVREGKVAAPRHQQVVGGVSVSHDHQECSVLVA